MKHQTNWGYRSLRIPIPQATVDATFPYSTFLSPFCGPMRVYPKLAAAVGNTRKGPSIEYYLNDGLIHYQFPTGDSDTECYMAHELKQH